MIRFLQERAPVILTLAGAVLLIATVVMAGCARGLPEPESEGAVLYVQFCSGSGCHDPIPPQSGGKGYWRIQYDRMLPIMQKAGWTLPDEEQDRKIREYLARFAG